MALQFKRGETGTLFANFLNPGGGEATTVVNPKVTIRHIDPDTGVLVTDVNEAAMTLAAETLYYYSWSIAADADVTTYTAEYEAVVDGDDVEATQDIQIISTAISGDVTGYTTKALVASLLGVDESEIEDEWIAWATGYIDTYTCRNFNETEKIEYFDIETGNTDTLFLKYFPIVSVLYVKDNESTVDTNDYLIYYDTGIIKLKTVEELTTVLYPYFTEGRQKVEVKYTYGYATIPEQITYAATLIAARIAKHHLAPTSADITEKQIGDTRVKYGSAGTSSKGGSVGMSITDIQENILNKYRRQDHMAI